MHVSHLQVGQQIEAAFWFRNGYQGNEKDYAAIRGTICRIMECYNRIQVNVHELTAGRFPGNTIWISCDKAEITINQ